MAGTWLSFEITTRLVSKSSHKKILRKLNRQALARIRDVYWPRHFQINADTRPGGGYGYTKRTKGYQIRKAKQVGHQLPNVFTGRTRTEMRAHAKIGATAHGGTLKSRTHFPRNADRKRELEAVSPRERREIAERYKRDYIRLANRPEYKSKRRLRGV